VALILLYRCCKFGEKICNNSRDIEFFLGDYFFLARPVYTWLDCGLSRIMHRASVAGRSVTSQVQARCAYYIRCQHKQAHKLIVTWRTMHARQFLTFSASVCVRPVVIKSPYHATGLHVPWRTAVGVFCCWSDCQDSQLIAGRHPGCGVFWRQSQTVAENTFIFAVLAESMH